VRKESGSAERGAAIERLERELRAEPRRWLVTGAAGFVGSHLVERLLALGQDVLGLDDLSTGRRSNLEAAARAAARGARFELIEGDVCSAEDARRAALGRDYVLHQAGLGSVPRSRSEPERCVRVNVEGTWTLLVAAQAAGVRRAVLASSSSVYGDCAHAPLREELVGRPLSPYAASKRAAEHVAAGLARGNGIASVALRYFNVVGPRQSPAGPYAAVVPRWAARLVAGRAPELEGDGRQTRDFTPVATVVDANLLAACSGAVEPPEVLNVGTGRETSLLELFELLVAACRSLGLERGDLVPIPRPPRRDDRRASRADPERARRVLGLEPCIDLARTLRDVLQELVDSGGGAS
jgi:UDP-N-acetylglucosamine 4-epimerase